MSAVRLLAAILLFGLELVAQELNPQECDFSGINLEHEVEKVIEMLTKTYRAGGPEDFSPVFAGLDIGGVHVTGMDKIRRYGPVVRYCLKGTAMVHMDLINIGNVEIIAPWRSCSGQQGNVSLRAEYSRFTVHLRVRTRDNGEKYLAMTTDYAILPVNTYNVEVTVEGLGDVGRIASSVFSRLLPSVPLGLWMRNFFPNFREALRDALEDANEVF